MEQNRIHHTPSSKGSEGMHKSLLAAFSPQNFSRDQLVKIIGEAMLKTMDSNDLDITTSTPTAAAAKAVEQEISPVQDEVRIDTVIQPFKIPTADLIAHFESIQKMHSIIGSNTNELEEWYAKVNSLLESYENRLRADKEAMNESFVKSLESISIISSITSKFTSSGTSPKAESDIHISQILNESSDTSVTLKLQQLIIDYKSQSFTKLEDYCSDNSTMTQLSTTIERTIVKLIPVLNTKLNDFTGKLNQYYTKLELLGGQIDTNVDEFDVNESFTRMIPPFELVQMNLKNSSHMDIHNIKLTLQSEYRNLTPGLMAQTDVEISKLNEVILRRCQQLKAIHANILKLNHMLYESGEAEYIDSVTSDYKDNNSILKSIGVNTNVINRHERQLEMLTNEKSEREARQADLKKNIIEIWSMLNSSKSNVNEIEIKLRPMMNLYSSCLKQMAAVLEKLEDEKRLNIGKFISSTRSRIVECWNKLMYDEDLRCQFVDFYIQEDSLLNEECLKIHNEYLANLERELAELEPLLAKVGKLDEIMDMKAELEMAQKNPSRLLKQNSFKVLRREELVRKKIETELPNAVMELKSLVNEWEIKSRRKFIVDGKQYLTRLTEIEQSLPKRRTFINSFSATSSAQSSARKPAPQATGKRKPSHSQTIGMKTPTPRSTSLNSQQSIIKRRNISDFTDPFRSAKRPSPKRQKLDTGRVPLLSISSASRRSEATPVVSPSRIQSPVRRSRIPMKSDSGIGDLDFTSKLGPSPVEIYQSKSSPVRKEAELLSDLEIENDDDLLDKENVKPVAVPMKMKFNTNEMFNLSAMDAETF